MLSLFVVTLVACATPSANAPAAVTQAQWDDALARLATLRAAFPRAPYSEPITVSFFEPITRRHFDGRGAVGVDPGRAMRMILVGPAGEPALDVWVTRDAWRLVVPAAHVARRGGRESPPGSPIGFFRSWFVDPLGGHLLALGKNGALVVRDESGGTLHIGDHRIVRRDGDSTESFFFDRTHAEIRPRKKRARSRDHARRNRARAARSASVRRSGSRRVIVSVAIIAFGAVSALGRGAQAATAGEVGAPAAIATKEDAELAASKLARPYCARVLLERGDEDRAASILRLAWNDLTAALDATDASWRNKRVGLALASSSGGMRTR